MFAIEAIPEEGFNRAPVRYPVNFAVTYVTKTIGDKTVVQFGKITFQGALVLLGTLLLAVGIAPVLFYRMRVPLFWSISPLMAMVAGYAILLLIQKHRPRVLLELALRTCVVVYQEQVLQISGIENVLVINSRCSRPGQTNPEGTSELLLRTVAGGRKLLHPLARDGQYGALNDLGERIAKAAGVKLELSNMP